MVLVWVLVYMVLVCGVGICGDSEWCWYGVLVFGVGICGVGVWCLCVMWAGFIAVWCWYISCLCVALVYVVLLYVVLVRGVGVCFWYVVLVDVVFFCGIIIPHSTKGTIRSLLSIICSPSASNKPLLLSNIYYAKEWWEHKYQRPHQ